MPSEIITWQQHANGTVLMHFGGEVFADKAEKLVILYVPDGETIRFGMENPGGQLVPASAIYTAVAVGDTGCLLKIRLTVFPNVVTAQAATISAPGKTPDDNETYLVGTMFLPNNMMFWASVKVGSDIIRLADEITAVASEPGTKCVVEMRARLLASKDILPDPKLTEFV